MSRQTAVRKKKAPVIRGFFCWQSVTRIWFLFLITSFLILALFPWSNGLGAGYFAHHRISQVILLLLCFASFLFFNRFPERGFNKKTLLVFAFYVLGLLSVVCSEFKLGALEVFLHWLFLGFLLLGCFYAYSRFMVLCFVVVLLVMQGGMVFLSFLYLVFSVYESHPVNASVIYHGVDNIRFFNQIQMYSMLPSLVFIRGFRFSFLVSILFFMNAVLLCVGGARGAILVVLVVLFICLFLCDNYKKEVVTALCLMALAFLFYYVCYFLSPGLNEVILRGGFSGRIELWVEIFQNLDLKRVFLGVGPGNYPSYTIYNFGHPHNSVLHIFMEWGGLACLVAVALVFITLRRAVLNLDCMPQHVFALFLGWVGALLYSLVDGVTVMPIAQTLFFIFTGLLWGGLVGVKRKRDGLVLFSIPVWLLSVRFVILVFIACIYAILVSVHYHQQLKMLDAKGPGFWINGEVLIGF